MANGLELILPNRWDSGWRRILNPSDEYFDREGGGMGANIFLILNIFSHKNCVILFYNIIRQLHYYRIQKFQ